MTCLPEECDTLTIYLLLAFLVLTKNLSEGLTGTPATSQVIWGVLSPVVRILAQKDALLPGVVITGAGVFRNSNVGDTVVLSVSVKKIFFRAYTNLNGVMTF